MSQQKEVYAVVGGSGLVGRAIVDRLQARGDTVYVFDIAHRVDSHPFRKVDITKKNEIVEALKQTGTTCIFSLASPHAGFAPDEVFWKVNVEGTKNVLAAAVEAGVRKVVHTSSSGVVFAGKPLKGVDETYPVATSAYDVYMETKAKAEGIVLAANGKNGLLTVALRPCGVFGPGDRQLMRGLITAFEAGQTGVQVGDNSNLVDWTYVENLVQAELLAADKLALPVTDPSMAVAGQAFFITNDQPWPFWTFTHAIWDKLYELYPQGKVRPPPRIISPTVGYVFATLSEFFSWMLGRTPTFTRFNVVFMSLPRWFSVEKAKRVLGYKPEVSVEEGIDRMMKWWKSEYPHRASDAL